MTFIEAKHSGLLLYASVEDAYDEPQIDAILLREAAKANPEAPLTVKTIRHENEFLAHYGDYMRGVFFATEN